MIYHKRRPVVLRNEFILKYYEKKEIDIMKSHTIKQKIFHLFIIYLSYFNINLVIY